MLPFPFFFSSREVSLCPWGKTETNSWDSWFLRQRCSPPTKSWQTSSLRGNKRRHSSRRRSRSVQSARLSADQLLFDLSPRGKRRLCEGEGVAARLQLALTGTREVRLDQVQLGGGRRALGLRLRQAGLRLRLVQGRGGGAGVEVRVRVRVGERVQPGVGEAFFCRRSLPANTNTKTLSEWKLSETLHNGHIAWIILSIRSHRRRFFSSLA